MSGSTTPGPSRAHGGNIQDGTLSRVPSPTPRPVGTGRPSRGQSRKLKVLGFDGAKVHELLFHVALSEIEWQDLNSHPDATPDRVAQHEKALNRASTLYDSFLEVCSQGPQQATSFLAAQHAAQKQYLKKSQVILHSLQVKAAGHEAFLSEVAFGAQVTKSAATAGVAIIGAIIGCLLVGPETVVAAGIALTFDLSMELINHLGSSGEAHADTVVVGFKQTVANDGVGLTGSAKQLSLERSNDLLQKTLRYPLKSSTYRATAAKAARLDALLKSLGWLSAAVTTFTEFEATKASLEEMQRTRKAYAEIR